MPKDFEANLTLCSAGENRTVMSNDVQRYRHFSYDVENKVVYFCDRSPYQEGMLCYGSAHEESPPMWIGE